jgi:hypothetical protein
VALSVRGRRMREREREHARERESTTNVCAHAYTYGTHARTHAYMHARAHTRPLSVGASEAPAMSHLRTTVDTEAYFSLVSYCFLMHSSQDRSGAP